MITGVSQGFARKKRLLKAREFKNAFDNARRFHSQSFLALVTPNTQTCSRIGFIIAKRNVANAVKRNCIRRLARESFRKQAQIDAIHLDIVIMINKKAVANANQQLVDEYESLWTKLQAYYSAPLSQ